MATKPIIPRGRTSATAVVAVLIVLVTTAGVAMAAGNTTISIAPESGSVDVDGTTTFRVVVDDADNGVGAGEIGIAVDDPTVAGITEVEVLGTGETVVNITDDGASADVKYAFRDTADTGAVTIIKVTVDGRAAGETGLSLEATEGDDGVIVFDEDGTGYDVTGTNGADLTVGGGPASSPSGDDDDDDDGGGDGGGQSDDASGEVTIVNGTLLNGTVTTDAGVVARVRLANADPVRGTIVLHLMANGSTVTERSVAVGPSTERTVFLRHEFDRPGTYEVSVNGTLVGVVSVIEETTPRPTATPDPTATGTPDTTTLTRVTDTVGTPTDTERAGTDDGSTTTGDGPGFGVLVALVSVFAFGLRLRRD
jgi:PGF-CTERM protein